MYLHMLGILSGRWMMEYSPMIVCSRKVTPIKNGVQTQDTAQFTSRVVKSA